MRRATGTGAGPDRTRHPASLAVLRELITDPEDCRQRFAQFLSSYWQACISPDWPTLEARLRADIARRGRAMSRRGCWRSSRPPPGRPRQPPGGHPAAWVRTDADQLDLTLTDHDQLLLVPSHFVWQS